MQCLLAGLLIIIMADAIQWSLPLGNGAVTLHYNEVVYSWMNTNVYVYDYDYEIMIVIHPQCISPFIFTRAAYGGYSTISTVIDGINSNGTSVSMLVLNNGSRYNTYLYSSVVAFLLK